MMYLTKYGEVPKRLKGLASNTSRSETAQGFKSLLLRYAKKRQQKDCKIEKAVSFSVNRKSKWIFSASLPDSVQCRRNQCKTEAINERKKKGRKTAAFPKKETAV